MKAKAMKAKAKLHPEAEKLLRRIRRGIRKELTNTQDAWDKHEKRRGKCDSGCLDRRSFQERDATLKWMLVQLATGQRRTDTDFTTACDDYEGMATTFTVV